jgi:nickel/cobalt transporter (NicO) family protein
MRMAMFMKTVSSIRMITSIRRRREASFALIAVIAALALAPRVIRADTVASLLGNFTINQYCGLNIGADSLKVHYVVVFGQLPALRELHNADTDGNGVTSQAERDAYVGRVAPELADGLAVRLDGAAIPLRAARWSSSLPTEQGGFSLRVDVDFNAVLPAATAGAQRHLQFTNHNYPGRMGWHEIVVAPAPDVSIYDTDAYGSSITRGLSEALQALPQSGPLDERSVHMTFDVGNIPAGAVPLLPRPGAITVPPGSAAPSQDGTWIARETRHLIEAISAPRLEPGIAALALLGALLLGAVHALSPGHGKTIVGAYLIGSRGTPRHAAFLGMTVTVTHTAGVFILGFATLYASRFIVPERLFPLLSLVSALLILGMGIVLLVQRTRSLRLASAALRPGAAPVFTAVPGTGAAACTGAAAGGGAAAGAGRPLILAQRPDLGLALHSHGGAPHSHLPPGAAGEEVSWRSLLALGVSGGLVPCPSAMVLLLAAVALNKTAYGMLLVVVFSVGLALTLTAVGLMFLYARNRFSKPSSGGRWRHWLPVMSAGTITVLGAALCVGALKSFGSAPF